MNTELTDRQKRELEYHRVHAAEHQRKLGVPFSWDVIERPGERWWNAYWELFAYLASCDLQGKSVLVVGCGFGDDALRIAKLGANVSAFDLSPESLDIAEKLAVREGLQISFAQMTSEKMRYPDSTFDYILARDILHHVDIPSTMREIVRVAKPGAVFVVDEIYSHSITNKVRRSEIVEKVLYPRMRALIYGTGKPYITDDERKLDERDLAEIIRPLQQEHLKKYFNFIVTRLVPDRYELLAKIDCLLLRLLRPFARYLAGRILFAAKIAK